MLDSIIKPMKFTLVRDSICQHIANARDEQLQLVKKLKKEDWGEQNVDFTIFPKRFRFPNADDLPCVYAYFDEGSFPTDEQDIYENTFRLNLQIEYYTGGITEIDETQEEIDEQVIITADGNAEDRLQYLTAQLYNILCSEPTNIYKATGKLVKSFKPIKWKRILTPKELNSVESVLGALFTFEVDINEETYYAQTFNIKEFYTSLNIKDEFIDPFVKFQISDGQE